MNVTLPNGLVVTDVPEDISQTELARLAIDNNLAKADEFGDLFDSDTSLVDDVVEFGQRTLGSAATQLALAPSGLQERFFGEEGFGEEDQALVERNRSVAQGISESFGYDEGYEGGVVDFLSGAIGGALPSYGAGLAGAGAGALIGGPAGALVGGGLGLLGGSAIGAGANVSAGMEETARAIELGRAVTDDQYEPAMRNQALIGLSEALPVGRLLKPIFRTVSKTALDDPKAVRTLTDYIVSAVKQGSLEAAQEATAGLASNANLEKYINPDIDITDSLASDLGAGGVAGAFFDVVVNLATRKSRLSGLAKAPKPIGEMTPEEIEREQQARAGVDQERQKQAAQSSEKTLAIEEPGPMPAAPADPFSTLLIDPDLDANDIVGEVISRSDEQSLITPYTESDEDGLALTETFNVQRQSPEEGGKFYVEQAGQQVGPLIQDPIKATDIMIGLNQYAADVRKQADVEYAVDTMEFAGTPEIIMPPKIKNPTPKKDRIKGEPDFVDNPDFNNPKLRAEMQLQRGTSQPSRDRMIDFAQAIPSPDERVITAEQAEAAVPGITTKVNKLRAKNNLPAITQDGSLNAFTLNEIRKANRGNIGNLGDVLAATPADQLAFKGRSGVAEARGGRPTPSLGMNRPQIQQFNQTLNNDIGAENAFNQLFKNKNIASDVNSNEFRGLVKRILGKTPPKKKVIESLNPSERQYLYHRIRALPSFNDVGGEVNIQSTGDGAPSRANTASSVARSPVAIPDFSVKTPDAEVVRRAKRLVREGVSPENAAQQALYAQTGQIPQGTETNRVAGAVEGTQAAERAGDTVPANQQMVPYDINESALGQQLRDMLTAMGLQNDFATRMVEKVGSARRDLNGNVTIDPLQEKEVTTPDGDILTTRGQANLMSYVIQIGLDGVKSDVKKGMSYEEAVAGTMNHEMVHALRGLDLFTAAEWSLLERLSRTYKTQDGNVTYAQWATRNYANGDATLMQEEAIAEMLGDALTGKTIIGNQVGKPSGKPAGLIKRIVNFFKKLVGFAENNDVRDFNDLVTQMQSGEVGARERGVIRTPYASERLAKGDIPARSITAADLATETGQRRPLTARDVARRSGMQQDEGREQDVSDAPVVNLDPMYSRKSDAGGRSARDMFSGTDTDMFDRTTGKVDYGLRLKSRKIVVDMPIAMFQHLAASMDGTRADSEQNVRELAEAGQKFNAIPTLSMTFESGKPQNRYIYDHDGRHRARQLQRMGYETVPVMVKDASIRWDQQDREGSFDRVKVWPKNILNQDGNLAMPMFINRDAEVQYGQFSPASLVLDPLESRKVAKPAQVDVISLYDGSEVPPKMKVKKEVARYLQERTLERTGAVRQLSREEDRQAMADDLAREAVYEYENAESAIEWYDQTIDNTIEMMAEVYPEIKKDKGAKAMFLASMAITSQNLAVPDNLAFAEEQYKYFQKNGKFKVYGKGDKKKSMEANFKKLNILLGQMTPAEIGDFLQHKFIVKDLNVLSKELLGKKADTGELAANEVFGSAIFGPKIGNGFYTNLRGDFSPITMDMWFMRTMGRLAGTVTGVSADKMRKGQERLAGILGIKRINPTTLERKAREIKSAHEKLYKNLEGKAKEDFEKPEKTKAAENLIKMIDGTNDVPNNGTHRNQLRDVTTRAISKFREATGVDIAPAAFQALIWYPEQDLYKSLGVKLKHVRQDYASSTERHLTKLGVDPKRLKRAKDRVRKRSERRAGQLRPESNVGRQDASGIKGVDLEVSQRRAVASPQQVDQAVDNNLKQIDSTVGAPRFSVKASPEAQYIAQNPESGIKPFELPHMEQRELAPGQQSAVDKLTKGLPQEASNGKVFMEATDTGPIGAFLTRMRASFIQRHAALEKYYQKIPMLKDMEADSSAIAAAFFADKAKGILASAVKSGVPVYRDGLTKVVDFEYQGQRYGGLVDVMSIIHNKDVGDLRKLAQSYAMVRRAKVLQAQGKPTPVTPADAKQIMDAVNQLPNDANGNNPVLEWHKVWTAYNGKTIEFLKATGILNEETADQWNDSSYVPFYREAQDDKLPKAATGVFGDLTRKSEFKAYTGSDKAVDVGLTEGITLNLAAAIEMGMKNVAQQRIARDMQALGNARQLKRGETAPNTVAFKVDGQTVRFEVDDNLVFDAMETLSGGSGTDMIIKYLGMPSNFLREMITRDPAFMLANMLRDTMSTAVTSGSSFIPIVDTVKGAFTGVDRLERMGVIGGYDFNIDNQDINKFYRKEAKRRGVGPEGGRGNPLNLFTSLWDAAGRATTLSDAATRNAVYDDVLARTGNEAEAAFQAMEVINFSRRGSHPVARIITAAIPFLNARFQGLDVFYRAAAGNYSTVKQSPGKTQANFLIRGGLLAGLTAMYWAMSSDEEWYKEETEEVRDNNWLFKVSDGMPPLRLPIPFEVGLLFKVVPESFLETTYGDRSAREAFLSAKRGVVSTLEVNPLGAQMFAPLIEAGLNHNFFTQRPIVPMYVDTKIEPAKQTTAGTTELAKFVGESLNMSPIKIDHVISGYTGTIGGHLIALADAAAKSEFVQGDDAPKLPQKNIFEFPLWRRFFASKEGRGLQQDAYELFREVEVVVNTLSKLEKEGRKDEFISYAASRQNLLALKNDVYAIKKMLDKARRSKLDVTNSDMEPSVKRQIIDDIDAQINEYLTVMPKLKEAADLPVTKLFN